MKLKWIGILLCLFSISALQAQEEKVFLDVEQMPAFPGCEDEVADERALCTEQKVAEFINNNIEYPPTAKEEGVEGRVILSYQIGMDGKVQNVKVIRAAEPRLDAEALRVINALPQHTPGIQKGEAVVVETRIPIYFRLKS